MSEHKTTDWCRPLRFLRAWLCYQLVMRLPWWRARYEGRIYRLHMAILPHAGTWAYQSDIRRDLGQDPWGKLP